MKRKTQIIPDSEDRRYVLDADSGAVRESPEQEMFEPYTLVSTSAGGEGNRLRYYFVIHQKERHPIGSHEKGIISEMFMGIACTMRVVIENVRFGTSYAVFQALIPFDVAVGDFIETGIAACHKELPFFCKSYFVTNVKKPTVKDLKKFLSED